LTEFGNLYQMKVLSFSSLFPATQYKRHQVG